MPTDERPPGKTPDEGYESDVGLAPERPGAEPPKPPGTVLPDTLRERSDDDRSVPRPSACGAHVIQS